MLLLLSDFKIINDPKIKIKYPAINEEKIVFFEYCIRNGCSIYFQLKKDKEKIVIVLKRMSSIEIEFISEVDLKVAYPAVICRYYSDKWHTSFHSSQRIMNYQSGDLIQENNFGLFFYKYTRKRLLQLK